MRTGAGWFTNVVLFCLVVAAAWNAGCGSGKAPDPLQEAEGAPADQNVGERIFVDTRFAEYFAENMTGVNDPLAVGDPVVAQVSTPIGMLPGPFAGQSINCRSCHFVTEFTDVAGVRNRTYADFVTHSPMPRMISGFNSTPRNAMQMVGSLQPHNGPTFLHFDGEFATPEDLVLGNDDGEEFWLGAGPVSAGDRAYREGDSGRQRKQRRIAIPTRTAFPIRQFSSGRIRVSPQTRACRRSIAWMLRPLRMKQLSRMWQNS